MVAEQDQGFPGGAVDPWILAGMPGSLQYASYLVERLAPQYRLIVDVLLEAQAHSLTGVARSDLPGLLQSRAELNAGSESVPILLDEQVFDLDGRMDQLQRWGVVEIWQDRATTEADFLRNRDRYQLTPEAAALHRFVLDFEATGGRGSSAALLAPPVIATRLAEFLTSLAGHDLDAASQAWAQIETTLADMAAAAGTWQAKMAAALAGAPNPEKITVLRTTLLAYVDVWGAGVDIHSPRISEHVTALEKIQESSWRSLALARLSAAVDEAAVAREVASYRGTVMTLRNWFDGSDSQGRRLRRQVRDIIGDLVRGHRTLLQVGGAVSRRAELLRVAATIEAAPDDAGGWDLWCRTTGLFSCRHLAVASLEQSDVGARTSFWDAPPAPVQARLRTHGPRALVGAPARVTDMSMARLQARRRAAAARHALVEAEAGIRQRSGKPLSAWGSLSEAELDLLLDLLSSARSIDDRGGRQGTTTDGRWRVRFTPSPDGSSAEIGTPEGILVCEDLVVEVVPA